MKTLAAATLCFTLSAAGAAAQIGGRREAAAPADAASVDAIVAALYASVSHAPGAAPDFERLRGIFLYVGMLIPPKKPGEEYTVLDVDQWEARHRKRAAEGSSRDAGKGFFEREIARRTDCFGSVCQVFSTYESRRAPSDAAPFERGVNSIQLLRDGNRWWIASLAWDAERPDNPIPAAYLPGARP